MDDTLLTRKEIEINTAKTLLKQIHNQIDYLDNETEFEEDMLDDLIWINKYLSMIAFGVEEK